MTSRAILALVAVTLLAVAAFLGGAAPFGRLSLALGLPQVATVLFVDPGWRGTAALQAGDFGAAARDFARMTGGDYNAGVALARAGSFAAALEAFDRALAANPDDAWARANFDLVRAVYAGTAISPDARFAWSDREDGPTLAAETGQGNVRAAGTGDDVTNAGTSLEQPQLESTGLRRIDKVFDDRFILANDRWLANLADVPGEYLAARIYEERKRRAAQGRAPPDPEDPR